MRKTLLCAVVAGLPWVAPGQDLSALAGTGRQASGVIGRASGTLSPGGGAAKSRTEALDSPPADAPVPLPGPGSRPLPRKRVVKAPVPPPPPMPEVRYTSEAALAAVKDGKSRAEVLAALGNPDSVTTIRGLPEGGRESFMYRISATRSAYVRLLNGVVVGVMTD